MLEYLLAVAGIIVSIALAWRFSTVPGLYWDTRTAVLIEEGRVALPGLKLLYLEEEIRNLAVTRVMLINLGRGPIRRDDLATQLPLQVRPKSGEVHMLNSQLLAVSTPAQTSAQLAVTFEKRNHRARIEFAYLNRGWGGVIQVVHTGTSSDAIEVVGDIVGVDRLRRLFPRRETGEKPLIRLSRSIGSALLTDSRGDLQRPDRSTVFSFTLFFVLFIAMCVGALAAGDYASGVVLGVMAAFFAPALFYAFRTRRLLKEFYEDLPQGARKSDAHGD